jgi:hypothetical protein
MVERRQDLYLYRVFIAQHTPPPADRLPKLWYHDTGKVVT